MPIIANTANSTVKAANIVMSRAYFPRAKKWVFPRLSYSYVSVKDVEPHAVIGAVPQLKQYTGSLRARLIPSFSANVPNLLFKNLFAISQEDMEFDQTRTLVQLAPQLGVRVAEFPDQLWAKRILNGSTSGSQTVTFRNNSYTLTLDGKPFFATDHPTGYNSATQSNIIQGSLPSTIAALIAQDIGDSASQMISDFMQVINAVRSVRDTAGIPMFPNLDTGESVVVVVPPCLDAVSRLAFRTPGANPLINQTTNVMPAYVKEVITSGYLAGFPDPEDESGSTDISPVNETDWYVFIVDDFVRPFYTQIFRPIGANELFPPNYSPADVVRNVVAKMKGITVEQATVFASTRIDTTFRRIGAEADAYTIQNEAFLCSARWRGNMTYGPHFTGWRIKPNGGT